MSFGSFLSSPIKGFGQEMTGGQLVGRGAGALAGMIASIGDQNASENYMNNAANMGQNLQSYAENYTIPYAQDILQRSKAIGTPEDLATRSGMAAANYEKYLNRAEDAQNRRALAMGIDPTSGRYQDLNQGHNLDASLGKVEAYNRAYLDRENQGLNTGNQAINTFNSALEPYYKSIEQNNNLANAYASNAANTQSGMSDIGQIAGAVLPFVL